MQGNFNSDAIERKLQTAVNLYCEEHPNYPPVWVEEAYVTGSYAVGEETESSDFDLVVSLGVEDNRYAYGVIATHISRGHEDIAERLEEVTPAECDLKLIPTDKGVRDELGVDSIEQYVYEGLELSGHSKVYDLLERTHVFKDDLA